MATTKKKPDYIGDEWFDAASAGRSVGAQGRASTGRNTDAPLEMPGDASKGAGVRSQGAAEQEGLDRAVAAASQMHSRPPPGGAPQAQATGATGATGAKQYAGDGNYLYEIRNGNELWIVGSGGKMRPPDQQRQVTGATPKGAIAYNAILAEIGGDLARDGIKLSPVRVPATDGKSGAADPAADAAYQQDQREWQSDRHATSAAGAMQNANAAQAAQSRSQIDADLAANRHATSAAGAMQNANAAQAAQVRRQIDADLGAIGSIYAEQR